MAFYNLMPVMLDWKPSRGDGLNGPTGAIGSTALPGRHLLLTGHLHFHYGQELNTGCGFHWGQAVWWHMQEHGLHVAYCKKEDVHTICREFLALPFYLHTKYRYHLLLWRLRLPEYHLSSPWLMKASAQLYGPVDANCKYRHYPLYLK